MTGDIFTIISGFVGVVLTLLVFSRLLGDNPAFKVIQYLFIGISLGFAFVVMYHQVLRPQAFAAIGAANNPPILIGRLLPFIFALLLLTRITGRQSISWLANIPLALLFGVASALALGGALLGTLVPQLLDSARPIAGDPFQMVGAVLLTLGVIATLCYFYFTVPRTTAAGKVVALGAQLGRWLLIIAFGFFFAGGLLTYLTALNERIEFVVGWVRGLFG